MNPPQAAETLSVSEFDFPKQTRELACRIASHILEPLRSQVSHIEDQAKAAEESSGMECEEAVNRVNEELANLERQFSLDINSNLAKKEDEIARIDHQLSSFTKALATITEQKLILEKEFSSRGLIKSITAISLGNSHLNSEEGKVDVPPLIIDSILLLAQSEYNTLGQLFSTSVWQNFQGTKLLLNRMRSVGVFLSCLFALLLLWLTFTQKSVALGVMMLELVVVTVAGIITWDEFNRRKIPPLALIFGISSVIDTALTHFRKFSLHEMSAKKRLSKIIAELEGDKSLAETECGVESDKMKKAFESTSRLQRAKQERARQAHAIALTKIRTEKSARLGRLSKEYSERTKALQKDVESLWELTAYASCDWHSPKWKDWSPDPSPEFAARLGVFQTAAEDLQAKLPELDLNFKLPALIPFVEGGCLLVQATGSAKELATEALQSVVIRALANTPPGKARFTLIDPVGLGQNVAHFIHLGDFNKDLISGKAWSEPQHIEQQLTLLTEHMEMVIQGCLRKEFDSIRDYNRERHEVALAFRFVVVSDFPTNFTETSVRRLVSIVKNGPRCGVFTIILHDVGKALPYGCRIGDLEGLATKISFSQDEPHHEKAEIGSFVWKEQAFENFRLIVDRLPSEDLTSMIVTKSGKLAITAMKVEVPFEKVLDFASLDRNSWWTGSSIESLRVPLGPAGARALQELTLGSEQEAHALLVGRTGSGKTNLIHVIITGIALKYSHREVQLYLIDFKGGVGFKRYAEYRLPHAKVIAIESEREFGMSILKGLDAELKQRSERFRAAGVDNLSAYRSRIKSEKDDKNLIPRILLVVDEFQEFFSDNDDLSQQAKILLERLARQGRSFGIHFLLATQSLSGSAQLPTSVMGQIKVRIALPCSEADSRLILAEDNKAARSLSLPGEAIYNPLGGLVEGNNRFQVAKFSDPDLSRFLTDISDANPGRYDPIIFEGNELARIEDCFPFKELLLGSNWGQANKVVDAFLGEPIAIMPPVTARFRRQSGRNLMILTREENEGVGMCLGTLVNILARRQPTAARIFILDFATSDSEWAQHATELARCFPRDITIVSRQRDVTSLFATIVKEMQSRGEQTSGQDSIYLFLQGMHRIKSLRDDTEDEHGQSAVGLLKSILRDGPEVGVHVIAWADTWGNATRGLDRRSLGEFGLRVAGVMDSGDSMNFLDSLAASKITKPHRALFYDEDHPGQLVTFRPYAIPPASWFSEIAQQLQCRSQCKQ